MNISKRFSVIALSLATPLALFAQNPAPTQTDVIQALLARIDKLEKRVAELIPDVAWGTLRRREIVLSGLSVGETRYPTWNSRSDSRSHPRRCGRRKGDAMIQSGSALAELGSWPTSQVSERKTWTQPPRSRLAICCGAIAARRE